MGSQRAGHDWATFAFSFTASSRDWDQKVWAPSPRVPVNTGQQRGFSGGPVVRALHFHCRGHGFDPKSRNSDPTSCAAELKKKRKNRAEEPQECISWSLLPPTPGPWDAAKAALPREHPVRGIRALWEWAGCGTATESLWRWWQVSPGGYWAAANRQLELPWWDERGWAQGWAWSPGRRLVGLDTHCPPPVPSQNLLFGHWLPPPTLP